MFGLFLNNLTERRHHLELQSLMEFLDFRVFRLQVILKRAGSLRYRRLERLA